MGLNFSPEKLLVVLVFALILLGPDKLPEAARKMGEWIGHAKRMSGGFQDELRQALDDPLQTFHREFFAGERHTNGAETTNANQAIATFEPDGHVDGQPNGQPLDHEVGVDATHEPEAAPADSTRIGDSAHAPSSPSSDQRGPGALPSWVFPGDRNRSRPGFH